MLGLAGPAAAETAVTLTLTNTQQVYDGSQKFPGVSSDVGNLSVELGFTSTTAPRTVVPVFNRIPDTLALSYAGLNFASNSTRGLGDVVNIAAGAQYLTALEVVLVSTAKASSWPALAAANPDGFVHPITLHVFSRSGSGEFQYLAQATKQALIPWRPTTLPDGSPYPKNGYAFPVKIHFPANTVLPSQVAVMVSFNTENAGFHPIGAPGPYNNINVALTDAAPATGTDLNSGHALWVTMEKWIYPSTGFGSSAPMFRLEASPTASPAINPPVDAGEYGVTATVTSPGYSGQTSGLFRIVPAAGQVALSALNHLADGTAKAASAGTSPTGLPVVLTYDGNAAAPAAAGRYQVRGTIDHPNYTGVAEATLTIGHSLSTWTTEYLAGVPAELRGALDDPDQDGLCNLLEYAVGSDPAGANGGAPVVEHAGNEIFLIYRRNLLATDLQFEIEGSVAIGGGWASAGAAETILAIEGAVQTVRASVPVNEAEPAKFLRLRVTRNP